MDLSNQIEGVISSSLVKISKESKIPLNELRIELCRDLNSKLVIYQMRKSVYEPSENYIIPLKKILGLALSMFSSTVEKKITEKIKSIETIEGLDPNSLTCRIYAIDSKGKHKLHLFKTGTPFKEITFNEIL